MELERERERERERETSYDNLSLLYIFLPFLFISFTTRISYSVVPSILSLYFQTFRVLAQFLDTQSIAICRFGRKTSQIYGWKFGLIQALGLIYKRYLDNIVYRRISVRKLYPRNSAYCWISSLIICVCTPVQMRPPFMKFTVRYIEHTHTHTHTYS
jgi:hypothetical protein